MVIEKTLYKTTKKEVLVSGIIVVLYVFFAIALLHHQIKKAGFECGLTCINDVLISIEHTSDLLSVSVFLLVLQFILSAIKLPGLWLSYKTERLLLTKTAIQYIPSETLLLFNKKPGWKIQLSEITGKTAKHVFTNQKFLLLTTNDFEIRIRYTLWRDPKEMSKKRKDYFSFKNSPSDDLNYPVVTYLKQCFGDELVIVDIRTDAKINERPFKGSDFYQRDKSFKLESNPLTYKLTIAFFITLLYAVFDLSFIKYTYASHVPVTTFGLIGIVVFFILFITQSCKNIPTHVALVLATLVGVTSSFACYPAFLRINGIASEYPDTSYSYQLQYAEQSSKPPLFIPIDTTLPVIEINYYDDYWSQFEIGSTHNLVLAKGRFGLWLLNMDSIRKKAIDYRQSKLKH